MAEIVAELLVKFRVMLSHGSWLDEEAFRGHGEKLADVGRAVAVQQCRNAMAALHLQLLKLAGDYLFPLLITFATGQQRCAVDVATVLHVELVGKFMKNEIMPACFSPASRLGIGPPLVIV